MSNDISHGKGGAVTNSRPLPDVADLLPFIVAGVLIVGFAFLLFWPEPEYHQLGDVEPPEREIQPSATANHVQVALIEAGLRHGVSPLYMLAMGNIESAGTFSTTIMPCSNGGWWSEKLQRCITRKGRRKSKPLSSGVGPCQFTWRTRIKYGLPRRNRAMRATTAEQQADACARLARDNARGFEARRGRKPSHGELYLAHFLGLGASISVARRSPGTPIRAAISRRAINANKFLLNYKTSGGVVRWAEHKMARSSRKVARYIRRTPEVAGWVMRASAPPEPTRSALHTVGKRPNVSKKQPLDWAAEIFQQAE